MGPAHYGSSQRCLSWEKNDFLEKVSKTRFFPNLHFHDVTVWHHLVHDITYTCMTSFGAWHHLHMTSFGMTSLCLEIFWVMEYVANLRMEPIKQKFPVCMKSLWIRVHFTQSQSFLTAPVTQFLEVPFNTQLSIVFWKTSKNVCGSNSNIKHDNWRG